MSFGEGEDRTILKFVTSGSVDDGKSTLIGRLLVETDTVFEDQLEAIKRTSSKSGFNGIDYSLLLDGLAAEREQGITIDVAYRYFSTPRRKFVVADCPGHEQYTRNMFTGASSADLAVILLDAERGVQVQSKRHGYIASMLRIPHLVVVVNKMDLVGYSQKAFDQIAESYRGFARKLDIPNLCFIPVSAVAGDNVTVNSANTPWYDGPTLLEHLETVAVTRDEEWAESSMRFPVQWVCRPDSRFRGYCGEVVSGEIAPGDSVQVLPSGKHTRIKEVLTYDGSLSEAVPGQAVTLTVEDELDISRGDMLVSPSSPPQVGTRFEALICWMDDAPLQFSQRYFLKQTTREVAFEFRRVAYRLDVNSLEQQKTNSIGLNDVGLVELECASPIFYDPFTQNRETGSFIVIDLESNRTVGAGLIREKVTASDGRHPTFQSKATNLRYEPWGVTQEMRELRNGHRAVVVWLTGLPSSGKSTIANRVGEYLFEQGAQVSTLDGDKLRTGLCADLGFSEEERKESLRRVGEVARLYFEAGQIVVCSFVSPHQRDRDFVRSLIPEGRFIEVFVKCSIELCQKRDPKGHYRKALDGVIPSFTGVSAPYEVPKVPDLLLDTESCGPDECANQTIRLLEERGVFTQDSSQD